MYISKYPSRSEWGTLLKRNTLNTASLKESVSAILEEVRTQGDYAVKAYEEKFDGVRLESLAVSEKEFEEAEIVRQKMIFQPNYFPLFTYTTNSNL